jgi:single-strand DNA-binding protein
MNLCIFTGRTTKDIELRYSQDNTAVGRFSLAVDTGYGDNKKTAFLNCVVFKNSAESMEKYVKKGTKIIVQAEVTQSNYTDKDGNKRSSLDFIVRSWEFAESKGNGEQRNTQEPPKPTPHDIGDGFMNIPDYIEEELPFS